MSVNTTDKYLKISRFIASKEAFKLSGSVFKLYLCLNEIEAEEEYTRNVHGKKPNRWFLCTDKQIREKTGMDIKTIQSAKKELKDRGFIKVGRGGWKYTKTGKSDVSQPCMYTILDLEENPLIPKNR